MNLQTDFSKQDGAIRALNGSNLGPNLSNQKIFNENEWFKALKVPYARLHDAPLFNPGMRLVDIQHIFGNWQADENDPRNYYFKQTDDYIRNIRMCGTDIIYRLGTSIEHTLENYFAFPPADFEKWTRICINIIRHYNEGWANGFFWNIRYWEIWNEPNAKPHMWSGPDELYFKLYAVAAKAIKERFPQLKVGGPALSCPVQYYAPVEYTQRFLAYCRQESVPLDFYSWHCYPVTLDDILGEPARVRRVLDQAGFPDAELHLNEWHYTPSWERSHAVREGIHGINGIDSACFVVNVLTSWQDSPLTMGNYYTCTSGGWGVFDSCGGIRFKTYFGLLAFAKMLDFPERVKASSPDPKISILAGKNKAGKRAVLVSAYDTGENAFELEFGDRMPEQVLLLDDTHDLEPVRFPTAAGMLRLEKQTRSALWLILS